MQILAVIVLAMFSWTIGAYLDHRRVKKLRKWAESRGFIFERRANHDLPKHFVGISWLQRGEGHKAFNIIRGEVSGLPFVLCDYAFRVKRAIRLDENADDWKAERWTVTAILPPYPLQPLIIRPEKLKDKVAATFGYDDLDFESAAFSKAYFVHAPNRRWAYDVLHTRAIEHIMACPMHCIEFNDRYAITWQRGAGKVPQYEAMLKLMVGLMERMPEYVIHQQRDASVATG